MTATYDEDVTLPDVWNADGTAAYVKYTLDGQNVTEDVIAGVIPKAMMDGYEEEETEDILDDQIPCSAFYRNSQLGGNENLTRLVLPQTAQPFPDFSW